MRRLTDEGPQPKPARALLIAAAFAVVATSAFAQDATPQSKPAPQPAAANPIVVERVTDQFVIAPEYKLTDMNGKAGQLVGVTGGVLMQEVFLIGGSVYHLVQGPGNWGMTYGGVVVGAQMAPERTIRFGARGLVGWGQASNVDTFNAFPYSMPYGGMHDLRHYPGFPGYLPGYPGSPGYPTSARMHVEENFFVFEPQGDLVFSITKQIRFGVSAGYRWTDSSDYFQHTINGVTGTFTVQVGF